MGFKAIWWLGALMGEHNRYDGKVWDYQPVWGTGNAHRRADAERPASRSTGRKSSTKGRCRSHAAERDGAGDAQRARRRTERAPGQRDELAGRRRGSVASSAPNARRSRWGRIRTRAASAICCSSPASARASRSRARSRDCATRRRPRHRGADARVHREHEGDSRGGRQLAGEGARRDGLPDRHAGRLRALQQGLRASTSAKIQPTRTTVGVGLAADADRGGDEGDRGGCSVGDN